MGDIPRELSTTGVGVASEEPRVASAAPISPNSKVQDPMPSPPSLLGFFLTLSTITLVIVAIGSSAWTSRQFRGELVADAEWYAHHMVDHVVLEAAEKLPERAALFQPLADERMPEVDAAIRRAMLGLPLRRLYCFSLERRITYATVPGRVGVQAKSNALLDSALAGHVVSEVVERKHELDLGGYEERPLLETYVPVRDRHGSVIGVVEVYQDASKLTKDVAAQIRNLALVSVVAVVIVIGVLSVVFVSGDGQIRTRTQALAEANRKLFKLTESLELEVARRTDKLVESQRLATLGSVASGVAHEINNPLASIVSAAEGLLRRLSQDGRAAFAEQAQGYLEIIRDEGFRAKAITRDLLASVHVNPTGGEPVVVAEMLHSVVALFKFKRLAKQINIHIECAPEHAQTVVCMDANRLRQVLLNITDNAVDALPEAGGQVTWHVEEHAGEVVMRCVDSGSGMSADSCAHVLEPFYTTKEPGQGTGLGLSICNGIVESYGGTLAVHSDGLGRGTVVTITLPVEVGA